MRTGMVKKHIHLLSHDEKFVVGCEPNVIAGIADDLNSRVERDDYRIIRTDCRSYYIAMIPADRSGIGEMETFRIGKNKTRLYVIREMSGLFERFILALANDGFVITPED